MRLMKSDPSHWTSPRRGYFTRMYDATPAWLSQEQRDQFHRIYAVARNMRKRGRCVHVDHIVPLNGKLVCGLNVPWNLQIVDSGVNLCKSNHMWPGHPCEPLDMIGPIEPQQLRLEL